VSGACNQGLSPLTINRLLPQDGAMTTFESMHQDEIVGKLTTVDRVIFNGYLMSFFWPGYFQKFLCRQDVLLKDFGPYVSEHLKAASQEHLKTGHVG
jgi:hypothetical protein